MSRYHAEPTYTHDQISHIGVLLVNLGTPDAPDRKSLRRYLAEFLWDPRVVEIPRPIWWCILNGFILTTRPQRSAEKYASIWTDEGSPLRVHTEKQTKLLSGYLCQKNSSEAHFKVSWAMRYGAPSISARLAQLKADGCRRILIIPMYPQYAASTTASVMDEVAKTMLKWRNLPEIRYIRNFHHHPGYIAALVQSVRDHWKKEGRSEKLVMSFHGIPKQLLLKGDSYHCECQATARQIAQALQLSPDDWMITFQSRLGRAEWLKPYTQPTLEKLATNGTQSVTVICPGFVADCLETLEEINMECRQAFLAAGGKTFSYVSCLNERDDWIETLRTLVNEQTTDWQLAAQQENLQRHKRLQFAKKQGADS